MKTNTTSQSGMVSLTVTLILMLVISMIVLGFAQVSRREQRQSLDTQLSTQAFFAAESGVNDVQEVIRDALATNGIVPEKGNCGPGGATPTNPYGYFNPSIDTNSDVSYSCLLVTTKLTNIKQLVNTGNEAVTIPLHPTSGSINTLHIKWNATNVTSTNGCANNSVPSPSAFPSVGGWAPCPYGVLRVDMVPTDPALLKRNLMLQNQKAFYLYPTVGAGTPTLNYVTASGAVAGMRCTVATGCKIDITNINGVPAAMKSVDYSLRLTALYNSGTVDITADGTLGPSVPLEDAQAEVDVTGRAQDVLRRIQVRLPITLVGNSAGFALQSGSSICKRFGVAPGLFEIAADIIPGGQDQNNPLCKP